MLIGAFSLFALLFGVVGAAHADVGPMTVPAEGGTLRPAATTDVAMKAEKVTLTYAVPTGTGDSAVMKAHVVAQFTMNNPTAAPKTFNVFFPADDGQYLGNDSENLITNLTVNGSKVSGSTVGVASGFGVTVKAYQWSQAFPAGDSTLNVEYDTVAHKRFGMFALTYVLGTGRNWAGAIGSGEVNFVLPENVQDYAVTDKMSLMKLNKLGHSVSGKTVKVAFTNYEPAANDVIVLGVGNPTDVAKIEQFRQTNPLTLEAALKTAEGIRGLSTGAHCFMCAEPAGAQAEAYYEKALGLATTKDQLEQVMGSYAYGGFTAENTLAGLYGLFSYVSAHPDCSESDVECNDKTSQLGRDSIIGSTNTAYRTNFLALYACRLRPFDMASATLVEDYAGKRLETCPALAAAAATQNQTAGSATPKATDKTNWTQVGIIAGAAAAAVVIIGVVTVLVRRRRRSAGAAKPVSSDKKPAPETTPADDQEKK
jgi:hypothetical protein